MLTYLRNAVLRFLGPAEPQMQPMGAAPMGSQSVTQSYPPQLSMRTIAGVPMVRSCATLIIDGLAALPKVVVKDLPDGRVERVRNHPVARLLRRPNPWQRGIEFWRQLFLDYVLTGNAYILRAGSILLRLHPGLVVPQANAAGLITAYEYNNRVTYDVTEVLHVADVSWSDDLQMVIGESAMRALHDDLSTSRAARHHARRAACRGRPEWLLSPKDEEATMGPAATDRVRDAWEDQLREGKAAVVVGHALTATPLSMSLRDMEFSEMEKRTEAAILAVFHVPPSMITGGASHATAKTDARQHWDRQQARAALFDEVLSELTGDESVRVMHDFSGVEALQVSRSERIDQAKSLVELGMRPYDALIYVGFVDPPMAPDTEPRSTQMRPQAAEEPDEPQGVRDLEEQLRVWQAALAKRWALFQVLGRNRPDPSSETMVLADLLDGHVPDPARTAHAMAREIHGVCMERLADCEERGLEPGPMTGLPCFQPAYLRAWLAHLELASLEAA